MGVVQSDVVQGVVPGGHVHLQFLGIFLGDFLFTTRSSSAGSRGG